MLNNKINEEPVIYFFKLVVVDIIVIDMITEKLMILLNI